MKKTLTITALLALALCVCFARPSLAVGPFSDIPAGHWAYDAAATLASQGIMTGCGDMFKGGRLVTRYEMASALAKALANADLNHATESQMKMLKNMAAELRDELDALMVGAEKNDGAVSLLEERIGAWSLSGSFQFDANFLDTDADLPINKWRISRGRLNLVRRFGEDGGDFFHAQMDSYRPQDPVTGRYPVDYSTYFSKIYVDFRLTPEWRMRVGRFSLDYETRGMVYSTGRLGEYSQGAWLTDRNRDGFAFSRPFSLGYLSTFIYANDSPVSADNSMGITGLAALQFNEKFTMDIGFDYKNVDYDASTLDSHTTVWIAPKYEFTPNVALRGAYYRQFVDYKATATTNPNDGPSAWRVIFEIKQPVLKYTSLWMEYNKLDKNFILASGTTSLLLADQDYRDFFASSNLAADLDIFRIGLNQVWNSRWSSWLYYARYKYGGYPAYIGADTRLVYLDPVMEEISAGIEYRMSRNVAFSLAYFYHKYNEDAYLEKNRILRFRTTVIF